MGAALMQGIKRGLFSNEAGMGSAPNAAATAHVTHPAKQGFIQALGVFTDTLLICSCTAFIILFSKDSVDSSLDGIQLTQAALTNEVGGIGTIYVAIATFVLRLQQHSRQLLLRRGQHTFLHVAPVARVCLSSSGCRHGHVRLFGKS